MSNIGYATLSVIPSMRGTAAALTGESNAVGTQAATAFSGGFNRVLSGGLIAAGVVAATGAALIAVGTQFDDAYDRIQTGTGATGDALEDLKDVFRDVVADVPTDFASAADAITLLNERLELTGRPLEELSEQFLNLSHITDTDLTGNIDSVTRAFGDWSVATEDQSEVLDRFFRASQDSGVAVSELAEGVVQFGSPLRQLGFSLDESIALFASFGEAGVNTSTVMSGMRQAVKNFASGLAENELGVRNFGDVLEGVRDGTFDLSDAMTLFGARAGADMFAAIQEGRFDLEDFLGAMRDTEGGIMDTAESTRDFGESFQILKNNVMLLLEGPATALMTWLSDAAEGMAEFAATVRAEGFGAGIGDLAKDFRGMAPAIQAAAGAVAALTLAFVAMKVAAILAWVAALGLPAAVIAVTLALAASVYLLVTNWTDVKGAVDSAVSTMNANIPGLSGLIGQLASAFNSLTGNILGIPNAIGFVVDIIQGDFSGAWDRVVNQWQATFGRVPAMIGAVMQVAGSLISAGMSAISGLWNSAWTAVTGAVQSAWNNIKSVVQSGINSVVTFLTALPARAGTAIAGLVSTLTEKGRAAMQGLRNSISTVWGNVRSFLAGLPDKAANALADLPGKLENIGREAIQGLWNGLRSLAGSILSWVGQLGTSIAGSISGALEVNSPSRVMERIGVYTMEGLEVGMRSGWQAISRWLRTLDPGADIFGDSPFGVNIFDIDDVQIGASRVLFDIQDQWRAIQQMFSDMPRGFQAGTQSGNAFMRALQDQAANIRNYVNALTAAGDYDGAAAALDRMVTMFRLMAVDAGLSADAIDDLISSLFGTLDLSGLADDVESQVARIEAATGRALDGATSSRYSGQLQPITVRVDPSGADSALVELLRRMIRVEAGGNVQAALGG